MAAERAADGEGANLPSSLPRGGRRKRTGVAVAATGVVLAAAIALGYAVEDRFVPWHQYGDAWYQAVLIYAMICLPLLAGGFMTCACGELLRRGEAAGRFYRFQFRSRRGWLGYVGLVLVALLAAAAAVSLMATIVYWEELSLFWSPMRVMRTWGRFGWRNYWRLRRIHDGILFAGFIPLMVFSIMAPIVVATSVAVNLSASRRNGGASELLLSPLGPELLHWSAAGAWVRRTLPVLLLMIPSYVVAVVFLSQEGRRAFTIPPGLAATLLVCLALLLEVFMIRRAAAWGSWIGASVKHPAVAGVCGAIGGAVLWGLRALMLTIIAIWAERAFGHRRDTPAIWSWIGTSTAAEILLTATLTPLFMWLARGALSAPWRSRTGRWLQRWIGGWLVSAQGLEASERSIWSLLRRPKDGARGRSGVWRIWMVWIFACAALLGLAIPIGGWAAELTRSQLAAPMLLALAMIGGLLLLAAMRLTMRLGEGLRRWVREVRN